jgi:hypothetical protein
VNCQIVNWCRAPQLRTSSRIFPCTPVVCSPHPHLRLCIHPFVPTASTMSTTNTTTPSAADLRYLSPPASDANGFGLAPLQYPVQLYPEIEPFADSLMVSPLGWLGWVSANTRARMVPQPSTKPPVPSLVVDSCNAHLFTITCTNRMLARDIPSITSSPVIQRVSQCSSCTVGQAVGVLPDLAVSLTLPPTASSVLTSGGADGVLPTQPTIGRLRWCVFRRNFALGMPLVTRMLA